MLLFINERKPLNIHKNLQRLFPGMEKAREINKFVYKEGEMREKKQKCGGIVYRSGILIGKKQKPIGKREDEKALKKCMGRTCSSLPWIL